LEMGDRERADLWESVFGSLADRGLAKVRHERGGN
jgi:hypothetical protein